MELRDNSVVCLKCGNGLKPIGNWLDDFRSGVWVEAGSPATDRRNTDQWLGTTCVSCHMVFCDQCCDAGAAVCPDCGGEMRPAMAQWLPEHAGQNALRILIAHTGENLAAEDINEILKYAWDGQFSRNVKITSNPLSPAAWVNDSQFAFAWTMWQQMLQHKYGEHPYWEEHKTHAYRGTIVRTQQRFYTEIYFQDLQEDKQKRIISEAGSDMQEKQVIAPASDCICSICGNAGLPTDRFCRKCGNPLK